MKILQQPPQIFERVRVCKTFWVKIPAVKKNLTIGGSQLTYVCTDFYFTIYTLSDLLLITGNLFSTCATTTKIVIYDILTFDPLIYTNNNSQLVPKIPWHDPGHRERRCTIGSLIPSLHNLRITERKFNQKITSLWMRIHQNHHPIGSLWTPLHHCIILDSRKEYDTGEGRHCECSATGTAVQSES